jgi:chromosome segregation ATPase
MTDPLTLIVGALGVLSTIAAGWRKRSEGLAAKDQASAAGILAIVGQVDALNKRCNTLEGEVVELRAELEKSESERQSEREMRVHFETLAKELKSRLELVEANAVRLKAEYLASLERAQPSTKSWRPNPRK